MQVIIEFIQLLISGVQQMFSFISELPGILSQCVNAFPPYLATILLVCFGLIVAIRVLELLP